MGRCMFLFSVAFFIVGVLITVFGFMSNTGIKPTHRLSLKILGPACLIMTCVMWIIGGVFSRLWKLEWKQQEQAVELRDRVHLHALAMDILNYPVISPAQLQDPRLRRELLLKLREQRAFDLRSLCSTEPDSRRPSQAPSNASRRQSSVQYFPRSQNKPEGSKPTNNGNDVPGIQISRFETLDFGSDGRASMCSRGSKRYIVIHSDLPSEFSRLSCHSDYSLAGSRSSKSRSSRASSGVSSRLWDFSPRDSEWDADVSLGSRESQSSVVKQDWGGGPSAGNEYEYTLSPNAPRKLSVVTFDMGSPSVRRHSSPASAMRRKESGCECTCAANKNKDASQQLNTSPKPTKGVLVNGTRKYSDDSIGQSRASLLSAFRKRSMEQSFKSLEEEDEPIILEETNNLTTQNEATSGPRQVRKIRPPLRRNNTDDSEVERRVARLFREIELSTTDSVDESKIHSFSSEFDSNHRRVDVREAEMQTLTEHELEALFNTGDRNIHTSTLEVPTSGLKPSDSGVGVSSCGDSTNDLLSETDKKSKKLKDKRSRFSKLSSAFASLSSSLGIERRKELVPTSLLVHGLSVDDIPLADHVIITTPFKKSPPPKYEDILFSS